MLIENLEFVYDRTKEDVDRVRYLNERYLRGEATDEEIEEWNTGLNGKKGLKGAFNLYDINRNERNCEVIAAALAVIVDTRQWEHKDIPRVSDYSRIRKNVQKIRESFVVRSDTPEVPKQPLNTYQKWNDIEKILYDISDIYIKIKNSYHYCDTEVYAGEGIGDL